MQIDVWQHERLGGIKNIAYQDVYAFGDKDANEKDGTTIAVAPRHGNMFKL